MVVVEVNENVVRVEFTSVVSVNEVVELVDVKV